MSEGQTKPPYHEKEEGRPGSLRILWFTWRDLKNPAAGGAEVFAHEVSKRLVALGHSVTIFTSSFPGGAKEEDVDGVKVLRRGGRLTVYLRARQHYVRYLSKERFDVVVDEINTRPFFAHRFCREGEIVVALIHQLAREYWFYETPFPISYAGFHLLEDRWLKSYVDVPVVTVSESTRKDLLELGFKEVHVVPEGINFKPLDRVPEKSHFPVVAYVGRLKKAKRPEHAIKAFELLQARAPDAELWVMGDGYSGKKLEKMAPKGVKFFRRLSDARRRELLARTWVLAVPGVREGFGLNVVEANALGVPAVAYDVPGLRDSVRRDETGLLVAAGDVVALAEGLHRIILDGELRLRLSEQALAYSRGFSWDNTAREFVRIVDGMLAEKGRRSRES